jgi:hypothetical protein
MANPRANDRQWHGIILFASLALFICPIGICSKMYPIGHMNSANDANKMMPCHCLSFARGLAMIIMLVKEVKSKCEPMKFRCGANTKRVKTRPDPRKRRFPGIASQSKRTFVVNNTSITSILRNLHQLKAPQRTNIRWITVIKKFIKSSQKVSKKYPKTSQKVLPCVKYFSVWIKVQMLVSYLSPL